MADAVLMTAFTPSQAALSEWRSRRSPCTTVTPRRLRFSTFAGSDEARTSALTGLPDAASQAADFRADHSGCPDDEVHESSPEGGCYTCKAIAECLRSRPATRLVARQQFIQLLFHHIKTPGQLQPPAPV